MRFSPSLIEKIRSHFLMSEVIGRRMPIKKHGREYQGLCPFHNEKTPSFTINDEKAFFHCFGCGAHGDAIEFVRRFERMQYAEAVETLAREAGITIAAPSPEESRKIEKEKTLYDVLEEACKWFEKQLISTSGMIAKDYIEKRGIKPDTLRNFRIGYAPDGRAELHQYLLKAGFSQAMQVEAGLIIVPETGGVYDRFRGRVMFPIRNVSGKVVAFGGRLLGGGEANKNLPKYLNSPETPLFKKGELLFNLDQAKRPAREANMVVVMEGYMDVVMSVQAGVNYSVATLGTAVTAEHLRLLWQLAKEPVMCLDGDAAGKRAMLRAADVALPLLKPSYSLRFAVLPEGEDPDTYVQKHGKNSFEKILLASRRLSQILWDTQVVQHNIDLPEGKAALDSDCQKLAGQITDSTVRQHYLTYFRKQLWEKSKIKTNKEQQIRSPHIEQMVAQQHWGALEALTERLLNILLKNPSLLHKSHVEEALLRLDIRTTKLASVRDTLVTAIHDTDIDNNESFSAYVKERIGEVKIAESLKLPFRENMADSDALTLWNETISTYEIAHLEYEFKEIQERINESMDEADYMRMLELQSIVQKLREKRTFAPADDAVES